jgi:serine/threonine protein kinase
MTAEEKHKILHLLGRGGMAEVFLALERSAGIERLVVLKRILPELASEPDFIKMFFDEATIASRLNHPNIAHVYEVGEQLGSHYLVMEFIHGGDLGAILRCSRERRLRPAHAALIASRVAAALHHAHNLKSLRGEPLKIVHRDISPQNIRISDEGIVKVLDFGIAKASSNLDTTKTGFLKGKFPYISPEQAQGKPLDGRADLFSLGVVLFEMLTYRHLFRRETDMATLEALLYSRVPPPSAYADEPVSPELDRIVARLLERDPARRYQTARELEGDLEDYLRRDSATAADLERLMADLFGCSGPLHDRLHRALDEGRFDDLILSAPAEQLPSISDEHGWGDDTERDAPAGRICEHCGEFHGSEHRFCTETGALLSEDQVSPARSIADTEKDQRAPADLADAAVIVDRRLEETGTQPSIETTNQSEASEPAGDAAFMPPEEDLDSLELEPAATESPRRRSSPGPTVEVRPLARPQPRTGWKRLAALVMAVTVGIAVGWWLIQRTRTPAGSEDEEVVQVRIDAEPRSAEILVDGVQVQMQPLWLQRSRQLYKVEVRASGYQPKLLTFRPERSLSLRVRLVRR